MAAFSAADWAARASPPAADIALLSGTADADSSLRGAAGGGVSVRFRDAGAVRRVSGFPERPAISLFGSFDEVIVIPDQHL
ncbi:hypothetical protein RPD_1362 [Rhodopseudomonas palustris BisB5]|uniref:Uncharacterized protein n=1 Tax=Rhodopseudomonas palustris (strain BisB5) TaxID=316057 RepID=Q13BD9_RHOPS|nr:hypothetical protein RPD_1362 [Rhodopseudomonas palustris BisB5]